MVNFETMDMFERALVCLYGFCKHKALTIPQKKQGDQTAKKQSGETAKKQAVTAEIPDYIVKRTLTRFKTAKYMLHIYKKYKELCVTEIPAINQRESDNKSGICYATDPFDYVVSELKDYYDADMVDLLFEAVNGIIEGGDNVDMQIKKAYHNLHSYYDQGKRQVYISEDTLIKATNKAFFTMVRESNNIDKYKQILTESECTVLDIIINQPLSLKGRSDGRPNVSIRAVANKYGKSISTTQNTVKQIRDKIYKIATETDLIKM